MCLTEAQAGSDVGAAVTKAARQPDGTYKISGTKVFISGGDQDLTENIVHLVLARIEGAPLGTKGLSLFIVPKVRVNASGTLGKPNDVTVASIEHKTDLSHASLLETRSTHGRPVRSIDEIPGPTRMKRARWWSSSPSWWSIITRRLAK
jgi:alkylation response protein AidB-like acyl-CoA dehydrogenase